MSCKIHVASVFKKVGIVVMYLSIMGHPGHTRPINKGSYMSFHFKLYYMITETELFSNRKHNIVMEGVMMLSTGNQV